MRTEKQKMLLGELYNARDPELSRERMKTRLLLKALNDSREDEEEKRNGIVFAAGNPCKVIRLLDQ